MSAKEYAFLVNNTASINSKVASLEKIIFNKEVLFQQLICFVFNLTTNEDFLIKNKKVPELVLIVDKFYF